MLDNLVVVVFKITFRAEIHVNDIFLFLILTHQNDPKHTTCIKF